MNKVLVASPRGFCAGVRRAVDAVDKALREYRAPIYCLNEIVHNQQVVSELRSRGVVFVTDLTDVPRGSCVVFSAHGVPPSARQAAEARDLMVIDATCPFVARVHAEVRRFAQAGYTILLIGHRGHDEIVGVQGEAPESVTVVQNLAEARELEVADPSRIAVVTQTTLSVDESTRLVSFLRLRFPDLVLSPQANICHATSSRQAAVKEMTLRTKQILVLGSKNSSNTLRLAEVAREFGAQAFLVSCMADLKDIPFSEFEDLGVTAGASTPDIFVREVLACLADCGFGEVEECTAGVEDAAFEGVS